MKALKSIGKIAKKVEFWPLILAYAIIVVFFSLTSPYFFTVKNFMSITLYASIVGILSLTTCLVLAAGQIDFAAGSVIALGSCMMGIMVRAGYSVWLAMAACLVMAVITGAFSGFLISYVGMSNFIATLAGMQMWRGVAYLITNARSIVITSDVMDFIGRGRTAGVPNAAILMLILLVLFSLMAKYTSFGRRIFVIGGSQKVAYLSGINVKLDTLLLYIIHGFITGICAIVFTAQLGAALPTAAQNTNFTAISACVLGGVSLTGGKGSLVGAVVGAILLETLSNGMNMIGVSSFWQDVITGLVLIFAVGLDIIKVKRAAKARI